MLEPIRPLIDATRPFQFYLGTRQTVEDLDVVRSGICFPRQITRDSAGSFAPSFYLWKMTVNKHFALFCTHDKERR